MMDEYIKELSQVDSEKISAAIRAVEAKYSIIFPKAYQQYALQYDGAKLKLKKFSVEGYECEISSIVPLGTDGLTFEKIADSDREDGFISDTLYPITHNRGGDTYYWDNSNGAVYLLLSDDIEYPFKVCESVDAFFDLLK